MVKPVGGAKQSSGSSSAAADDPGAATRRAPVAKDRGATRAPATRDLDASDPSGAVEHEPVESRLAVTPPQSSGAELDPARFRRVAELLHEATRNKVSGLDLGLAVLTLFASAGTSMRRLEGHIEPEEANKLVAEAWASLPAPDRRALAVALKTMIDSGAVTLASDRVDDGRGGTKQRQAKDFLRPFVDQVLGTPSGGQPGAVDKAIGTLLANADIVRFRLHDVHRLLQQASKGPRAVGARDNPLTDANVEALRVSLARVPRELGEATRAILRETLSSYSWSAAAEGFAPLRKLRELVGEAG